MSIYSSLNAAISAGTTNMTVLRDNVKQDDGADTVTFTPTWFNYNNQLVTALYASGNSWLGIGYNAEHLKVNRRDAAMWSLYTEVGSIGITDFFKLRWEGYSTYNSTSDSARQQWEVFFFSTGQIYLHYFQHPTSNNNGNYSLVCGSQTLNYSVTTSNDDYLFTPSNVAAGTGWSVTYERPAIYGKFKPSGSAIFAYNDLTSITNYSWSRVTWTATCPEHTNVAIEASLDQITWVECEQGSSLPVFSAGQDYSNDHLYLKALLTTEDDTKTPTLVSLQVLISNLTDTRLIRIIFPEGNQNSFQNAIDDVDLTYTNGNLAGINGLVAPFTITFTPHSLDYKENQLNEEHISLSATASCYFPLITYTQSQITDHLSASATATGVLTHVDDLES